MGSVEASWEDDSSHRRVDMLVRYQVVSGQVEIESVTPQRVHFRDPESGHYHRSVGVHTATAKQLLLERALVAGAIDRVRHYLNDLDVHEIVHPADTLHDRTEVPSVTV